MTARARSVPEPAPQPPRRTRGPPWRAPRRRRARRRPARRRPATETAGTDGVTRDRGSELTERTCPPRVPRATLQAPPPPGRRQGCRRARNAGRRHAVRAPGFPRAARPDHHPAMLKIDLAGRRALVAGVADDGGYGFAIAKALAEAGATVSVATWPPALTIFRNLLERGKMDEGRRMTDGSKLEFERIYPFDAAYDTLADAPEDIRTNKRYKDAGDFSVGRPRRAPHHRLRRTPARHPGALPRQWPRRQEAAARDEPLRLPHRA